GVLRARSRPAREPLAPRPTLAYLPRLIEGTGLSLSSEPSPGDPPWPEAVERAAYRAVQEALTNIAKPAPRAPVGVRLPARAARLLVEVHNERPPRRPGAMPLPGGGHG
ncbi:hypothetical protein UK12_34590, partial [Saccharothrix sp. ST-888]